MRIFLSNASLAIRVDLRDVKTRDLPWQSTGSTLTTVKLNSPHFDLADHLRTLFRSVLPLFLLISLLGFGLVLFFTREREETPKPAHATNTRIGLIDAHGDVFDPAFAVLSPVELALTPSDSILDYPMGSRQGALTYNAQPFLENNHLGDDHNGIGGGNSDLGDPVFASTAGYVVYAGWAGSGWGNVVILQHRKADDGLPYQTLYSHLDRITVYVGQGLHRGEMLGTVGNARGKYLAHLHYEVRGYASLDVGGGYAPSASGRWNGELFHLTRRGRAEPLVFGAILEAGEGVDWAPKELWQGSTR